MLVIDRCPTCGGIWLDAVEPERISSEVASEAMMAVGDSGTCIQLLAPLTTDSPIGRFLDRSGPGIQQMAYRVVDISTVSAVLRQRGVRLLYDIAKTGTAGSQVNFIHPKDAGGVLVELVQPPAEPHA